MIESFDCVIVGGGPGGLTAATYLARFRRRVVVIDAAGGRAEWIPLSHNIPGFPEGVGGRDFLALLRRQAGKYGAVLRTGRVEALRRADGRFVAAGDGFELAAPNVILATGVVDKVPDLPNLDGVIARGLVRLCPICDGYEATGRRIGVLGSSDRAVSEGRFLTTYTADVTLLGEAGRALPADVARAAAEAGLRLSAPLKSLAFREGAVAASLDTGETLIFDAIYVAMGNVPQTNLASQLGAACNEAGCIVTDDHQRTSVDGLYAIGDVVDELNQVAVATGHAAIAATAVHNALRR